MTKWKRDETEFPMRVVDDGKGSRYVRIPKPVDERLGVPAAVTFLVLGRRVEVRAG